MLYYTFHPCWSECYTPSSSMWKLLQESLRRIRLSDFLQSVQLTNYRRHHRPDLPAAQHQPNTLEQGRIKLTALLCGTNLTSMLSVAPAQNFAPQHNGGMMKGFCSSMPAILTGYKRMQHNRINESLYKKKNTINSKSCTLVYRKSNQVQ